MFGPNSTPHYHHRCGQFEDCLLRLEDLLVEKCELEPDRWSFCVLTGSGSLALESWIWSLRQTTQVVTSGEFSDRIREMVQLHGKDPFHGHPQSSIAVQYETADSRWIPLIWTKDLFVDAVSSFPYYDVPPHCIGWCTVSGKQLGGMPGVSIVAIDKQGREKINRLIDWNRRSYLNLARYLHFRARSNQTPNTPAIQTLEHLCDQLELFDLHKFRNDIDHRREMLQHRCLERGIPIRGTGPVFTARFEHELIKKYQLYTNPHGEGQLFLWAGRDEDYVKFVGDL